MQHQKQLVAVKPMRVYFSHVRKSKEKKLPHILKPISYTPLVAEFIDRLLSVEFILRMHDVAAY